MTNRIQKSKHFLFSLLLIVACACSKQGVSSLSDNFFLSENHKKRHDVFFLKSSIKRTMTSKFYGTRHLYNNLLDQPELVARCLQALNLGKYEVMVMDDKAWYVNDHHRLSGHVTLLGRSDSRRVFHAYTKVKSPFGLTLDIELHFDLKIRLEDNRVRQDMVVHIAMHPLAEAVTTLAMPFIEEALDQKLTEVLGETSQLTALLTNRPNQSIKKIQGSGILSKNEVERLRDVCFKKR